MTDTSGFPPDNSWKRRIELPTVKTEGFVSGKTGRDMMEKRMEKCKFPIVGHRSGWKMFFGFPRISLICLVTFIAITVAGCMDMRTHIGRYPYISALESSLRIGESTRKDVLAALGEPYGKGSEMLPFEITPRPLWSYYYEEGSLKDSRRIFLFVFFDKDRFDGYMWFSSLPK